MAGWRIFDVSKFSAQYGLRFKQLDCNPERTFGFVMLYNSSDDILRVDIDMVEGIILPDAVDLYCKGGKLDLNQANYLKMTAGTELADFVSHIVKEGT